MSHAQRHILIALYLEQRPALHRFLSARLRCSTIAEEIMRDMLRALENNNIPHKINNPTNFLFRMASNLALEHIRNNISV